MTRPLSIYLDLVRFSAALVVFLGHMSRQYFGGGLFYQFLPFLHDAVAVFFVLSGFVIGHVVAAKEHTARDYAIARAARIASVAFPAILLTLVLDQIGQRINPDLYAIGRGFHAENMVWQFLAGPVFLNKIWFLDLGLGSNVPFWSMTHEVWYYVIFGVWVFATGTRRIIGVLLLMAFVGPPILLLLPVWLAGVLAQRFAARHRVSEGVGAVLFLGSILGYAGLVAAGLHDRFDPGGLSAWLSVQGMQTAYVSGPLFALNLIGFSACGHRVLPLLRRIEAPIRWCAGASFSLYLFHWPIAQFLTTITPWPTTSWASRAVIIGGTLVLVFVCAEFTERRKSAWRRAVTQVVDTLVARIGGRVATQH